MYPGSAAAVTTGDTSSSNFSTASVVYVGGGGNVRVLTAQGDDVIFYNVLAGTAIPVQVLRVFTTNTTATLMTRVF
jgi:hypothetical protein